MSQKFEAGIVQKMADVALCACKAIVHTEYLVPLIEQSFTKVGAQKTTASRYYDAGL
jgi:hypothetical protein